MVLKVQYQWDSEGYYKAISGSVFQENQCFTNILKDNELRFWGDLCNKLIQIRQPTIGLFALPEIDLGACELRNTVELLICWKLADNMIALSDQGHGGDCVGSDGPGSDQDVARANECCRLSSIYLCDLFAQRNKAIDLPISLLLIDIENITCCSDLVLGHLHQFCHGDR